MNLNKKQARTLFTAIDSWRQSGLLSSSQAEQLRASIKVVRFDWQRLARYSFWFSIICVVIAVAAVLSDTWLMNLLKTLFNAPETAKLIISAIITGLIYAHGLRRRNLRPDRFFGNEAVFFLGVLGTALSIGMLGKVLNVDSEQISGLLLLAAIIYGLLGLWFPSKMIWFFALLSLGSWLGAETGYVSGWGAYYLGMNFPLRFVFFGLLLILASHLFRYWPARRDFTDSTLITGLLYFFIALWIMSIFGNYGDVDQWRTVQQSELLGWSLAFALAALVALLHGIRYDNSITRGFGLTFLFINLYTRYFEYFWNVTHKALFFALLAISFWYLGNHAEKLWNMGTQPEKS